MVTEVGNTLIKAGDDLLATIKDVATGAQKALLSNDIPLYRYEAVDLGSIAPTGNDTRANAINDRGQIVGRSQTTGSASLLFLCLRGGSASASASPAV
ncbi:MAG: hypothetical protein WBL95_09635 [Microcoleus sp.]